MGLDWELRVSRALSKAFVDILGKAPVTPEPVVVLSAYVYSLVDGYGLTDSQHLEPHHFDRDVLPAGVKKFLDHFLGDTDDLDGVRNALYRVFVDVANDAGSRRILNKNRPDSSRNVLLSAQVAWNLEFDEQRPLLPLRGDKTRKLDIEVPNSDMDFAIMNWTERSNQRNVPGKTVGDGFRRQAARLAVLAAKSLISTASYPGTKAGGAQLVFGEDHTCERIVWMTESPNIPVTSSTQVSKARQGQQIFVGDFAEVGGHYQPRRFDDEIAALWDDGDDRRVWLRGGPGLGKSYAARKIMQETLAASHGERHDLLIWVDSADAVAVTREFSRAAERLGNDLGSSVAIDTTDRDVQLAHALIDHLRTSAKRWLIVLDDADAEDLIEHKLVPPGTNPMGRVLITTLSGSHRIAGAGRQVDAALFSSGEAGEFLANRLPDISGDDRAGLSETVSHHPLALSIAASTITANSMTVSSWIAEFHEASRMDEVADYSDVGGYPRLIGATWRLAVERASQDMPHGMVERAAMVAALQDPDGHPTWLWQRDDVMEWVADGSDLPQNRTRMHPGVKRLAEYGIVRLTGSWQDGRLVIHQLAARAIREAAAPEALAKLAEVLADQWLLELTEEPSNARPKDVRAAMGPIAALANLTTTARDTANALLDFSQPSTSELFLGWERAELELLRPYLARGGVMGRADLARRLTDLGLGQRVVGWHAEAYENLTQAADIYSHLAETPDLSDDLRANYVESLADLDAEQDRPIQARDRRMTAAKLRERFEASEIAKGKPVSNLLALADLYHKLSDTKGADAALDRALSLWKDQTPADMGAEASSYARFGRRFASLGRLAEAKDHMIKAAELHATTQLGRTVHLKGVARELGYICAQSRDWGEAEEWFSKSGRDLVPLASVLLHQNRLNDARSNLAHAAKTHTEETKPEPGNADAEIQEEIAELALFTLQSVAQKAMERERWEDAAALAAVCLELTRTRAALSPGEDPRSLAQAYLLAGFTAWRAERAESAIDFFTKCVNIFEMLVQITPSEALDLEYGQSLYLLASSTLESGVPVSAAHHARCAVKVLSRLTSVDAREYLSEALSVLGRSCLEIEDVDEAVATFRLRVHIWQAAHEKNPGADTVTSLAGALKLLWGALFRTQRLDEAVQPLMETITLYRTMSRSDFGNGEALARALFVLAYVHQQRESSREAASFAEQSVHAWQEVLNVEPSNLEHQIELAYALWVFAESLSKLARDADAVSAGIRAADHLQLATELQPNDHGPLMMQILNRLESALRTLGRGREADDIRARADELVQRYPQLAEGE